LRRLSKFLRIPYQEKMLDPAGRSERYKGMAQHRNLALEIQQRRGKLAPDAAEAVAVALHGPRRPRRWSASAIR
jgi:hypothetical protein